MRRSLNPSACLQVCFCHRHRLWGVISLWSVEARQSKSKRVCSSVTRSKQHRQAVGIWLTRFCHLVIRLMQERNRLEYLLSVMPMGTIGIIVAGVWEVKLLGKRKAGNFVSTSARRCLARTPPLLAFDAPKWPDSLSRHWRIRSPILFGRCGLGAHL